MLLHCVLPRTGVLLLRTCISLALDDSETQSLRRAGTGERFPRPSPCWYETQTQKLLKLENTLDVLSKVDRTVKQNDYATRALHGISIAYTNGANCSDQRRAATAPSSTLVMTFDTRLCFTQAHTGTTPMLPASTDRERERRCGDEPKHIFRREFEDRMTCGGVGEEAKEGKGRAAWGGVCKSRSRENKTRELKGKRKLGASGEKGDAARKINQWFHSIL
eukprot:2917-Pleurochrysis_carterae.AAC.3